MQKLNDLKAAAHRIKNTQKINGWQIEAARVAAASSQTCLSASQDTQAFDFFDVGITPLMKDATSKLGIDPEFHVVSAQPHQLIVYDRGEGDYVHKFDREPGNHTFLPLNVDHLKIIYYLSQMLLES